MVTRLICVRFHRLNRPNNDQYFLTKRNLRRGILLNQRRHTFVATAPRFIKKLSAKKGFVNHLNPQCALSRCTLCHRFCLSLLFNILCKKTDCLKSSNDKSVTLLSRKNSKKSSAYFTRCVLKLACCTFVDFYVIFYPIFCLPRLLG